MLFQQLAETGILLNGIDRFHCTEKPGKKKKMGSERSRTRSRPVQECPGSPDRQGSSRAASRLVAGSMPGSISTTMWSGPLRAHQEFLAQGVTKASLRSSAAPFPGRCGAKPKCNASPPPVCTSASTGRLGRAIPLAIRSNTGKRIRPSVRCAALSSHARCPCRGRRTRHRYRRRFPGAKRCRNHRKCTAADQPASLSKRGQRGPGTRLLPVGCSQRSHARR